MKHSLNIGKEPSLQKIVIASVVLHLLFITLIAIPIKTKEREFRSYFVNLVGPTEIHRGVRTHVVKKGKNRIIAKKKIATAQKTLKARPKPKADMSLESVNRVAKEIERLRAISALAKKREKSGEKPPEIQIGEKKSPEEFLQSTGISGEGSGEKINFYYSIIQQKINQQWVYPDFESAGLEVIISIKIDKDGKVILQEIEKSSGDLLFDHSAIKAISKASPLPPPPIEMEIGVRFYL